MSEEADLIRSFVSRWGDAAKGIGDDAAVVSVPLGEKLVVSTDASVENVHFRRGDITPSEIGYRATAAAISDLAAMAARPIGLLFALTLPVSWRDDANAIADGVGEAAKASGCLIIGGNVSRGEELSIVTTVLGSSVKPLTRRGALPGNCLYVTGTLGASAAAVADWARGRLPSRDARQRFIRPVPRINEAIWLAANGATSAIDISDGLAGDAAHIAEAGGVTLTIDLECVPFAPGASPELALSGGEDYELLVTAPAIDAGEFQRKFGVSLTRIGSVEKGPARVVVRKDGREIASPPGFDHLASK